MTSKSSRESRKARLQAYLSQARIWGCRAAIAAAVLLFVWGSLQIRARVRSDPRFDLSGNQLVLGELPGWAPEELRREIEEIRVGGTEDENLTVFTPRVLARIREQILRCSWIRDVRGLRLRTPAIGRKGSGQQLLSLDPGSDGAPSLLDAEDNGGAIDLELEMRIPIAAVAAGGSCFLTDREGIRMGPPLDPARVRELKIPMISGGESRSPRQEPPPGGIWGDRDVREGLDVARILADARILEEFPQTPIDGIDISNVADRSRPGEPEIVLTAGRLRLAWGRSTLSPGARTAPPSDILRNLRWVLSAPERFSHVDLVLLYTKPLVGVKPQIGR